MAREVREIDRLIEAGLTLYGQGDLDGALVQWERALAMDPENAQANSYVEYVRTNYALLTDDLNGETVSEAAPFGIADDEPEYQIEIQPGEIRAVTPDPGAPLQFDPQDEGWFIDQETQARYGGPPAIGLDGRPSQEMTLELEADEPPGTDDAPPPEPARRAEPEGAGVSFDDATREYQPNRARSEPYGSISVEAPPVAGTSEDFGPEGTPGFGSPHDFQTPPGFGSQATGVKQRDLGFVKAAPTPNPTATVTGLGLPQPPRRAADPQPLPAPEPAGPPPIELALDGDEPELSLETDEPPAEPSEAATIQRKPISEPDLDDDLIASLPSPRPAPIVPQIEIETPLSGSRQTKPLSTTRDMPLQTRAPAFSATSTRDLAPADTRPAVSQTSTQDFEVKTQQRNAAPPVITVEEPAITSAPTRDLGLREAAKHALADAPEGTRADVVLPFDPIDARAAEILEEIDDSAPQDEPKEDQTRRRISTLFEKAARWTGEGDLERAVAAVELALLEDPNSALAQKLIHRNRETIMTVFQAYLGDLDRTPQLARPLHELASAPISPRAAFLLSRIDGLLTIDEILDVCGMPRLEAYRYLCQLFLRGILR